MTSEFRRNLWINLRERCNGRLERPRRAPVTDDPAGTLVVLPPHRGETWNSVEKRGRVTPPHRPAHHKYGTVGGEPDTSPKRLHRREKAALQKDLLPRCDHGAA